MPQQYVPERFSLDDASLGQCFPDECVPWTKRPWRMCRDLDRTANNRNSYTVHARSNPSFTLLTHRNMDRSKYSMLGGQPLQSRPNLHCTKNPIYVFPEKETARPRSQFLHSCICGRYIHYQDRSAYLATAKQADWSWEYINRSQIHECMNVEIGRQNIIILFWKNKAAPFHFLEYITRNQTFILDSHRPFTPPPAPLP